MAAVAQMLEASSEALLSANEQSNLPLMDNAVAQQGHSAVGVALDRASDWLVGAAREGNKVVEDVEELVLERKDFAEPYPVVMGTSGALKKVDEGKEGYTNARDRAQYQAIGLQQDPHDPKYAHPSALYPHSKSGLLPKPRPGVGEDDANGYTKVAHVLADPLPDTDPPPRLLPNLNPAPLVAFVNPAVQSSQQPREDNEQLGYHRLGGDNQHYQRLGQPQPVEEEGTFLPLQAMQDLGGALSQGLDSARSLSAGVVDRVAGGMRSSASAVSEAGKGALDAYVKRSGQVIDGVSRASEQATDGAVKGAGAVAQGSKSFSSVARNSLGSALNGVKAVAVGGAVAIGGVVGGSALAVAKVGSGVVQAGQAVVHQGGRVGASLSQSASDLGQGMQGVFAAQGDEDEDVVVDDAYHRIGEKRDFPVPQPVPPTIPDKQVLQRVLDEANERQRKRLEGERAGEVGALERRAEVVRRRNKENKRKQREADKQRKRAERAKKTQKGGKQAAKRQPAVVSAANNADKGDGGASEEKGAGAPVMAEADSKQEAPGNAQEEEEGNGQGQEEEEVKEEQHQDAEKGQDDGAEQQDQAKGEEGGEKEAEGEAEEEEESGSEYEYDESGEGESESNEGEGDSGSGSDQGEAEDNNNKEQSAEAAA